MRAFLFFIPITGGRQSGGLFDLCPTPMYVGAAPLGCFIRMKRAGDPPDLGGHPPQEYLGSNHLEQIKLQVTGLLHAPEDG